MTVITRFGIVLSLFSLFAQTGCSLKRSDPDKQVSFQIQYEPAAAGLMPQLFSNVTPPTTLSGFDCLTFNVVGSGIAPQDNFNLDAPGGLDGLVQGLLSGKRCSYPGITSQPFSPSSNAMRSLTVPAGARRIIQVLGIKDSSNTFCSTGSFTNNDHAEPFEVGRAVVDLFADTSVNITSNYNTLSVAAQADRKVACEFNSTSFSPATLPGLRMWYKMDIWRNSSDTATLTPAVSTNIPDASLLINQAPITNSGFGNMTYTEASTYEASWHNTGGSSSSWYLDFPVQQSGLAGSYIKRVFDGASFSEVFGSSSFSDFSMFVVMASDLVASTPHGFVGFSTGADFDSVSESFYIGSTGAGSNEFTVAGQYNGAALPSLVPSGVLKTSIGKMIHHVSYINSGSPTIYYKISGRNGANFVEEPTSAVLTAHNYNFSTGSQFMIGSIPISTPTWRPMKGQIYEVLFFNRKLNNQEESEVQNYLRIRHGI